MPLCVCPHCRTQLWVKDSQLNLAQGYVVCRTCQGLFQARSHTRPTPENFNPDLFPSAGSDSKLIQKIGPQVRSHRQLSRQEIADLLDGVIHQEHVQPMLPPPPAQPVSEETKWILPCMVALTVLFIQLFYLTIII
ncbi:MAG: hypothetical protein Q4A84_10950 [Neisseria sp.]|uniref:MJ0042-type zinc finger domain-containing protein n=1 Tax=Neisseria sp. TaxID=192066 RepID=UPI0026DD9D79|nr:MJ0042-type zinc finger domain-containing protein [Neisseria sp.]MDO4642196.1 hypothetical protein [Neisseria sp.]